MKIIAAGKGDVLLIEATKREVSNLCGAAWEGDKDMRGRLEVGTEIQVAPMFERLGALHVHRHALGKVGAELRAYADRLQALDPIVEAPLDEIFGAPPEALFGDD